MNFAVTLELPDHGIVNLQRLQAVFSSLEQSLIISVECQNQFFLGIDKLRRVERIQGLAFFDRVSCCFYVELLYPPLNTRMNMNQLIFIVPTTRPRPSCSIFRSW